MSRKIVAVSTQPSGYCSHRLLFVRVRKIAKSDFLASPCLSVRMEQLGSHWTDFHEILHSSIFRKSVEKIRVSLQSDKKKRLLHTKTNTHTFMIYRSIIPGMRNVLG
jgi:hypothetical protein